MEKLDPTKNRSNDKAEEDKTETELAEYAANHETHRLELDLET